MNNTMNFLKVCFILCSIFKASHADLAGDLKRNGLTTLLELVVEADLAETLGNVEPATIFAPTNAAFESVPKDVLNSLLDDKRLLKDTLLNHIIPNSAIKFQDLKEDNKVSAAGGHLLRITVGRKSGVSSTAVNGVQVLRTDILAGSGSVIHTVNGVIPSVKESDNVGAIVSSDPQFSTLLAAIKKAGLTNALSTTDGITVFAPTNDAFAKIPEDKLQAILADKDTLTAILSRHVVPKVIYSKVAPKKAHQTLNPKEKILTRESMLSSCRDVHGVKVSQLSCLSLFYTLKVQTYPANKKAQVVKEDILASNGVIHAIDAVV